MFGLGRWFGDNDTILWFFVVVLCLVCVCNSHCRDEEREFGNGGF